MQHDINKPSLAAPTPTSALPSLGRFRYSTALASNLTEPPNKAFIPLEAHIASSWKAKLQIWLLAAASIGFPVEQNILLGIPSTGHRMDRAGFGCLVLFPQSRPWLWQSRNWQPQPRASSARQIERLSTKHLRTKHSPFVWINQSAGSPVQ